MKSYPDRELLFHRELQAGRWADAGKYLVLKGLLVDLIGIEPMTSPMP
jgi:hypothetical protein